MTNEKIQNTKSKFLNSRKIQGKISIHKKLIKKVFDDKIKLIKKLIDYQVQLTDLYFRQRLAKEQLSEIYHDNKVEDMTLLNQINLSYSILILIESSFYGSARVILRQFFEFLIIGKFSEYDNGNIIRKWESKTSENREFDISLSRDVLHVIRSKKNIDHLQKTWKTLSDMSHPTKYAQQVPPFSSADDHLSWMKLSYQNIHFTFDLFFMMLCMNHHLLTQHWGRKSRGWYMGYHKDPVGFWQREKNIKEKTKTTMKEYFQLNEQYGSINTKLKKTIFQYKQSWS